MCLGRIIGKQWANSHDEHGVTIDSNTFELPMEDDVDAELRAWSKVAALFERAATYAAQGQPLPDDLKAALRFLLGG